MEEFKIDDNPLISPPQNVCRRGTQAIFQHLRDLDLGSNINAANPTIVEDSMVGGSPMLEPFVNRKPSLQVNK